MNNVDKVLELELQNEDEGIFTQGDDVLSSFYYGNFSQGIKEMLDYWITPRELGEYLADKAEEFDCSINELYNGHFTLAYFGEIGEMFEERRNENNR